LHRTDVDMTAALQVLARITGTEERQLDLDMPLEDLPAWDSFAMLELQFAFDEDLGIDMDPLQVGACRTIRELLCCAAHHLPVAGQSTEKEV
jgi:acyl carrier protein